jgi:hypothetical protein
MTAVPWSEADIARALEAYDRGGSLEDISDACGRQAPSVRWLLYKMKRPLPGEAAKLETVTHLHGDIAFKKAMLRARKTGTGSERTVKIGIFVDRRPLPRQARFYAKPIWSMVGSSSGSCAAE